MHLVLRVRMVQQVFKVKMVLPVLPAVLVPQVLLASRDCKVLQVL